MHLARLTSLAAVVAACSVTVAPTAGAQDVDRWSFRAAVGPSVLTGDQGDLTDLGFAFALAPELRLGGSAFRLGLELSSSRYGLDPDAVTAPGAPVDVDGTFTTFALALTGTYHAATGRAVAPFVRAGVGPHGIEVAFDGPAAAAGYEQSDVGYFGGVGLELRGVRFAPSLEVRYTSISTSGERTNFVPVMVGLRF